jgi:hypothetical protein
MNHIFNYIDELMVNQPSNEEQRSYSESEYFLDDKFKTDQKGNYRKYGHDGGKLNEVIGLGGFPPIYLCTPDEKATTTPFEDDSKTKREFSKSKAAVSIANIMEDRKQIKPFINLE